MVIEVEITWSNLREKDHKRQDKVRKHFPTKMPVLLLLFDVKGVSYFIKRQLFAGCFHDAILTLNVMLSRIN